MKRIMDIVISASGLILISPILLLSMLVKLSLRTLKKALPLQNKSMK